MAFTVSLQNVSKRFQLYESPGHRLREALLPFGKRSSRDFWALRGVSFEVEKGRALGIIGRNGSGKSTLLQIICGILRPTGGSVVTRGRISALLELGAGFNPEYSGRSNVFMNLALLGLPKQEIQERLEPIERFADIGRFIDQPVKIYSSGMFVRLAFACAISVEPEVLAIDEALAVGDVFFQQKCFAKLEELVRRGTTCIFVSHDTTAVMRICDEILLLAGGETVFKGAPQEGVSRYYASMGAAAQAPRQEAGAAAAPVLRERLSAREILEHSTLAGRERHGPRDVEILAARVTDAHGRDTLSVPITAPIVLHVLIRANRAASPVSVGIHLYDRMSNLVFASGTYVAGIPLPDLAEMDTLVVRLRLSLTVQPGEYTFSLGASSPYGVNQDRHEMLGPIQVTCREDEPLPFFGLARLPLEIDYYRAETGDGDR